MNDKNRFTLTDIDELYKENIFIKLDAERFVKTGSELDKERLLLQLVIRSKLDLVAPTPMVDTGVTLLIASSVDEEGRQWIPLFTDLDELMRGVPTEYTIEIPIRDLIEEAFGNTLYEGIIINPHSENVRLDRCDLDYILDVIMRMEAAA